MTAAALLLFLAVYQPPHPAGDGRETETIEVLRTRLAEHLQEKRIDEVIRDCNAIIRLEPKSPHAYSTRAMFWMMKGDRERALADFGEAERLKPNDVDLLLARSMAHLSWRDFKRALEDAEKAMRLDPKRGMPYALRGTVRLLNEDFAGARKDADEAIRLEPTNPKIYPLQVALDLIAEDMPRAVKDVTRAIELSPDDSQLLVNRADLYLMQKKWDKALDDLNAAVCTAPGSALPLNRRACVKACCPDERYRDGKQAVEDATQACQMTGWNSGDDLTSLAAAHAECGDFKQAVRYQKQAMETDKRKDSDWMERSRQRLKLYQGRKPLRLDF